MSFDCYMATCKGAYQGLDLVLCLGHRAVWDYGFEGGIKMERTLKRKFFNSFTDFGKGFIAGFVLAAIIFSFAVGMIFNRQKNKELIEYAERQIEIQELREDYLNRDFVEFLETLPDVRTAADGAAAEFERKRDEILERFRSRIAD